MITIRGRAALALLAVLALVGAACAEEGTTTPPGTTGTGGTGVCATVDTSTGDALANVCENGVLRVATDAKYEPQSWFDVQSQTWKGFDVEVAQEIANRLGVDVELQNQKWAVVTAGSWNDRWDLSVGSMTDTVEREEIFNFTPAYYFTPAGVAVADSNTSVNDLSTDLDGKRVCVGVETTYQSYLNKDLVLGATAPPFEFLIDDAQIVTYDTDTDALDHLALGDGVDCDAAISASPTIQSFIDKAGPIKLVGDSIFYEPLSIALDKNAPVDVTSLHEAVSDIVEEMHADGTLSALSEKWYETDLTVSAESS